MKKVTIKIKSGGVSADFSGFVGNECEKLEERIRLAELENQEKLIKPEYHHGNDNTEFETNAW